MLLKFRMDEIDFAALMAAPVPANFGLQPKPEGPDILKHRVPEDGCLLMGLKGDTNKLLCWVDRDDLQDNMIDLPMSMLSTNPDVRLRFDLQDMHCYIFRDAFLNRWDELFGAACEDMFSLREEFIPFLVEHQWDLAPKESYRCALFIAEDDCKKYCMRTNSLVAVAEASKQLTRTMCVAFSSPQSPFVLINQAAEIHPKAQIGTDSLIGPHTSIGERSAIKRSVVGKHVRIGKNAKISNCFILDYAVIEDGCKLEGCNIGYKSVVCEKSTLKDCDVASRYTVKKDTSLKCEVLAEPTLAIDIED